MDWFKVSCLCILGFFLKVNVQNRDIFWVAKIPLGGGMLLLLPPQSAGLFSVDALGERVEYLVSVVKEGLEALYCLSMHDLLFKMVPLNNSFFFLFFMKNEFFNCSIRHCSISYPLS